MGASGTIVIRQGSATGAVVASYDVATNAGVNLSISGSTLTINPTSNLGYSTDYYVTFSSGAILDLANNAYAGTSTYNFITVAALPLTLVGTSSANILLGDAGNDIITGAAAIDTMNGGAGSDVYIMTLTADHAAAEIQDDGSSGTDEVRFTSTTASTLTLYAGDTGIETVVIGTGTGAQGTADTTGTSALNVNAALVTNGLAITGNAGANTITGSAFADTVNGGAGNDTIDSGSGRDTLTGGGGVDKFIFSTTVGATNIDVITDFTPGSDKIVLDGDIFTRFAGKANVSPSYFIVNSQSLDSNDYLFFNTANTTLYYDKDGSGAGVAIEIAVITVVGVGTLSASDFLLVA